MEMSAGMAVKLAQQVKVLATKPELLVSEPNGRKRELTLAVL